MISISYNGIVLTSKRDFRSLYIPKKSGCWEANSYDKTKPYPYLAFGKSKKKIYLHRVSYTLHHGQIKKGMNVLHSCDNYLCINPEHLSLGSQKKNIKDAYVRGRMKKKLTQDQINQIISAKYGPDCNTVTLAIKYNVSATNICDIRKRYGVPSPRTVVFSKYRKKR